MTDLRAKMKAAQKAAGVIPSEEEEPEDKDAPSCPDVVELTRHTDTPGAARFRAAQDCVRAHQVGPEGKHRCFGRTAISRLVSDLLDALSGECRLTIRWTRINLDEE